MKYTNVHRHLPPCYFKKGNGLKIIDINTALLRCRRRLFLVVFSFNHRSRKWEKTFYGQKPTTLHFPIVSSSVCPWCSRFSLSLQCYTLYPLETGTSRAAGPGVSRLLWKGRSGPGRRKGCLKRSHRESLNYEDREEVIPLWTQVLYRKRKKRKFPFPEGPWTYLSRSLRCGETVSPLPQEFLRA